MKRHIESEQRLVEKIFVKIDGSAVAGGTLTTDGLLMGKNQVKITENGSGDYTLTLNTPGSRDCFAVATGLTDNSICYVVATDNSTVQVKQETCTTGAALADADLWVEITKFDSADET